MSHQLGVAVIGCGHWGVNYIRLVSELPDTELISVCDQSRDRLNDVARRFTLPHTTTDIDEIAGMDNVDIVIVCTTAVTHYDVTRKMIMAGKHVLVEKPMTTDADQALELVQMAEAYKVKLMVGHIFLFNPGIEKVKSCMEQDSFGQLYYLYSQRTNLGPIRHDVNVLWDLATHDVSIFNYLMGCTPEWVSAVGSKILHHGREDVGFVALHYPNGVIGHIHVSWLDPNKVRELVVVGSKRRIAFDDLNLQERVRIYEKGVTSSSMTEPSSYGEYQLLMQDGDIISPRIPVSEPLRNQMRHFLDCIIEDKTPRISGYDGMDVVRLMQAIDYSIQNNGAPVHLASSVEKA